VETKRLLAQFTDAVTKRDGARFAGLFAEDGVYHDVFYGAFKGRQKIAELIDIWFYKTAHDFKWDMLDPVSDGRTLYARYLFSYVSDLPGASGQRVVFEGVSCMKLCDGLILEYHEVANTAPALLKLNFPPERVARIMDRQDSALRARTEAKNHI
jgi:ketosteroid isomerase-like protein